MDTSGLCSRKEPLSAANQGLSALRELFSSPGVTVHVFVLYGAALLVQYTRVPNEYSIQNLYVQNSERSNTFF